MTDELVPASETSPVVASQETALVVSNRPELGRTVIAFSPAGVVASTAHLLDVCASKLSELSEFVATMERDQKIAKDRRWNATAFNATIKRAKDEVTYYKKIRSALEAGYHIVPDVPAEVIAIRTDRDVPHYQDRTLSSTWQRPDFQEQAGALPAGEGAYVSQDLPATYEHTTVKDYHGKDQPARRWYTIGEFRGVGFPMRAVVPVLVSTLDQAMSAKVFDEIGLYPPGRKPRDPMLVGRILCGRKRTKLQTFLIAWWLNESEL
jgi:hypothetical protein